MLSRATKIGFLSELNATESTVWELRRVAQKLLDAAPPLSDLKVPLGMARQNLEAAFISLISARQIATAQCEPREVTYCDREPHCVLQVGHRGDCRDTFFPDGVQ